MFLYIGFSLLWSEHPLFLHFPRLFLKYFLLKLKLFWHNSYCNKNLLKNTPKNQQKSGYSLLQKYPFWNEFAFIEIDVTQCGRKKAHFYSEFSSYPPSRQVHNQIFFHARLQVNVIIDFTYYPIAYLFFGSLWALMRFYNQWQICDMQTFVIQQGSC